MQIKEELKEELKQVSAKDRVEIELGELNYKIDKLKDFISSENFNKLTFQMQRLLREQQTYMEGYSAVLRLRLKIWDKTQEELNKIYK